MAAKLYRNSKTSFAGDYSDSGDTYNQPLVQEFPFESSLINKYIRLKNVSNNNETIMYQIQSITSPSFINEQSGNQEDDIPKLVKESTNQWLLLNNYKCNNNRTETINFCNALIIVAIQIISYFTLAYYLTTTKHTEIEDRTQTCYGPNCNTADNSCMDIKTGTVTALLLLGFLWADFISTFSMIRDSFNGRQIINKPQFFGSMIILIELISALCCAITVGIFSVDDFDAINGAIGILFVHDLDEKMYLAMDSIDIDWKKISALLLWIILSLIIAMCSACIYHDSYWFGAGATCKESEFKCGNGQCIWYGFVCNGVIDCKNGNDESQDCDFSLIDCPQDMFRCDSTGQCIDASKRCNGELDCAHGEDESRAQNCTSAIAAIECGTSPKFERKYSDNDWYLKISDDGGTFKCNNGQCIDGKYVCDSIIDCMDGSDEYPLFESVHDWPQLRECPYAKLIECDIDEVLCKSNGKCLNKLRVCDGIKDCPQGEDERECKWVWGEPWCEFVGKYQCGGQIAKVMNDSTILLFANETFVHYYNKSEMLRALQTYSGGNGPCLPIEYRCDGIKDCEYGDDEMLCEYFECKDIEDECPNGQCIPQKWDCTHIPYCDNEQYNPGFFLNNCDWSENITYMGCDEIVRGIIAEDGGYFNRYDVFIPCPYKAVKFTTCTNYSLDFDTSLQGWDETMEIHFENDDAEWLCDINYFASTSIINSNQFECDRMYTVMVGGKYQQESIGEYGFQTICSETDL